MDSVAAWLAALVARPIDWDIILRFVQALAWPVVTVAGLIVIRPGRIIDALLDGGEVSAGPATLKFRRRIEEITETIEDAAVMDAEAAVEEGPVEEPEPLPQEPPVGESADPYTTVMNGWALLTKGLDTSTALAGLPPLRKSNPLDAVEDLRRAELIDRRHVNAIVDLFEIRNGVKNAGSNKSERGGLTQHTADQFYKNADAMRRSIITTTKRRLRRKQKPGDAPKPDPHTLN